MPQIGTSAAEGIALNHIHTSAPYGVIVSRDSGRVPLTDRARRKTAARIRPELFLVGLPTLLIILLYISLFPHALGLPFDYSCAALAAVLCAVAYWWHRTCGRFDWTEPPVWTSAWVFLNVIASIWVLDRQYIPAIPWLDYSRDMPKAVALIGVGLVAMWGGHVAGVRGRPSSRLTGPPRVAIALTIWVACTLPLIGGVALNAGIAREATGPLDRWTNYIAFSTALATLARNALIIQYLRVRPRFGWCLVGVSVAYELVLSIVAAKKGFALSIIMLAMCVYYGTKRVRLAYWLPAAALVLFFVPVVTLFRANTAMSADSSLSGRVSTLRYTIRDTAANTSVAQLGDALIYTVVGRQGGLLASDASIMSIHPDVQPYLGGQIVAEIVQSIIPRVVLPTKPIGVSSLYFNTMLYWGAHSEHTFTAIGQCGDAYRAGGWLVVVLWSVFAGWFLGRQYRSIAYSRPPVACAWYVTVLFLAFYYENDLCACCLRLVEFCPLLWLIARYAITKKPTH